MLITIELTPSEGERLRAVAHTQGRFISECAREVLTAHLPEVGPGQATRSLIARWLEEDASDDPNLLQEAEEELAAFKRAINDTRAAAGARSIYP